MVCSGQGGMDGEGGNGTIKALSFDDDDVFFLTRRES